VAIWANTLRAYTLGNDPVVERLLGHSTATLTLQSSALWILVLLRIFTPVAIRTCRKVT
jgi:hypothetical protein